MTGDTAVRVDGLVKRFGDLTALDDVSFEVRDGEFFTMLGPSGCGKTTLLRILAGLETATAGTISINGATMGGVPAADRPTSMVFQNLALFPFKNVFENLTFGLKMAGHSEETRRDRAAEMLALLDLEGYGDKRVDELSGGERQRVALGRSLIVEPDILLLDEPLSSLDVQLRKEMQMELRRIHRDLDSTFLYVTHDQEIALTASDRIAVLNDGAIVQTGTPEEVYEEPATPFVARFVGETNLWSGTVETAGDAGATVAIDGGHHLETPRLDGASPADGSVTVSVRPNRIRISESPLETANEFQGTITERIYQGEDVVYRVAIDGTTVRVRQPVATAADRFDESDDVYVGWETAATYVVTGAD